MSGLQAIESKVIELLATNAKIRLTADERDSALHLDSLATLEVILGLEREYGLELDESEMDIVETFQCVASIAAFVQASLADLERQSHVSG